MAIATEQCRCGLFHPAEGMTDRTTFFDTKIEYLKGVGPQRAALLNNELSVFTYRDLLQYYPFRYEDRTRFHQVVDLSELLPAAQLKGRIRNWTISGEGSKKRLVAQFSDHTGTIDLVWFQGISYYEKNLRAGSQYVAYGKPIYFGGTYSITHPELELVTPENELGGTFQPVYNLTEKLRRAHFESKAIAKLMRTLLDIAQPYIHETLPSQLLEQYRLIPKVDALENIHLPRSQAWLNQALRRLKFEELFYNQLRLIKNKLVHKTDYPGQVFHHTRLLHRFYKELLPFELTNAQKNVLREIHSDLTSGKQMNRLLQGDVGSGKTIVAFITLLMAIDSGAQACIMAPTEILADQHYQVFKAFADKLGLPIGRLTGSTKTSERKRIHEQLLNGSMPIIVGTHALLEDIVQFQNLGLCIIDEQHRFGVAQRARLWNKNQEIYPHMMVMTATPIPRTLAMTLYGNLDLSIIDELPAGRKPIKTVHRYDTHRLEVFGFMRQQIELGRQVYVVYPLIEESEKLDFKDLMDGYESIVRAFPTYPIGILHGRMNSVDKDFEMARFVKGETKIMVATTVIEVGVHVPNASVMVVESTERFGLAQLHQLRGRVGRDANQSYCILMSGYKLSQETRTRIETMVRTNNGFEIADVDLQLRGPGDLAGTQQSGIADLVLADLAKDGAILVAARESAKNVLEEDLYLVLPKNAPIRNQVEAQRQGETNWSRIS